MHTEYRIVWVSRDYPDIIEEIYSDGIECLDKAREDPMLANNIPDDDGLNWFPRIQRVTYEFI